MLELYCELVCDFIVFIVPLQTNSFEQFMINYCMREYNSCFGLDAMH